MSDIKNFQNKPTRKRFSALVQKYQTEVYQVAWRVIGDHSAAEDVVQEVFVKLLDNKDQEIRSDRSYLAWQAMDLARRELRSRNRRQKREEESTRQKMNQKTLSMCRAANYQAKPKFQFQEKK